MNKKNFVHIDISMIPGHPRSVGIALQRPGHERTNRNARSLESAVCARRKMNPVTQQGANVPDVELHHRQVPLPSRHIERTEVIEH